MDIEEIKRTLSPQLSKTFNYVIDRDNNWSGPRLLVFDYSPNGNTPSASFAFCLTGYDEGVFPRKCWMTENKIVPAGGQKGPLLHLDYGEFLYNGHQFYPFSVQLGEYSPQNVDSIKCLVASLYQHIKFD